MKQILQNMRSGVTTVAEVPAPRTGRGQVLICTQRTLVSVGTERMLVEFGRAGFLAKARQQPDKVKMVLEKVRTDGLMPTIDSVRNKLDQPLALGYCNAGVVIDVGAGVSGFSVGDRVVSNGKHAEIVSVPGNLCAHIPDTVSFDDAAFAVVGAIGLQGIRLAQPTLGEFVAVTGLGLIGLITVQLLKAQGCHVLGIDFDAQKLELARKFDATVVNPAAGEDPVAVAQSFSRGRGLDAVILTAATKSSEPVHQAAQMCRKRGRIVLVGVTGLELSRADFYEKELSFQVSCSYGPGRYDPNYEEKGNDYPVGLVRWTEQRNFEAVLDMMASGSVEVAPLVTHRYSINDAASAYNVVAGAEPSLGILLEYPGRDEPLVRTVAVADATSKPTSAATGARLAFVGSGNYAAAVLIPAFKKAGAHLVTVASSGGVSGAHAARKHGFRETTTDTDSIFSDPRTNTVVIATRHDSHAALVTRALRAGKHVFVEKPLALTHEELDEIQDAYSSAAVPWLMVGFNRRFAPHVQKMHALLGSVHEPKSFLMTVNAGAIPANHWTQDHDVGGGRIIGEGCHFVDLLRFLAGTAITSFEVTRLGGPSGTVNADKTAITLRFADGSFGTIMYLANGHKSFPKERLEVFAAGSILQLDNFRSLKGYGWPGFSSDKRWRQDKGQIACAAASVNAISSSQPSPIPFAELMEVSRVTIDIAQAHATR